MPRPKTKQSNMRIARSGLITGKKLGIPKEIVKKTIREIIARKNNQTKKVPLKQRIEINLDTKKRGDQTATISKTQNKK